MWPFYLARGKVNFRVRVTWLSRIAPPFIEDPIAPEADSAGPGPWLLRVTRDSSELQVAVLVNMTLRLPGRVVLPVPQQCHIGVFKFRFVLVDMLLYRAGSR